RRAIYTHTALTVVGRVTVAGFLVALPCAYQLLRAAQPEVIVLEHSHVHAHGARGFVDDVGARNDLRQVFAHGLANFLIVAQPVPRATREQLIPFRETGRAGICAAFAHVSDGLLR